MAANEVTFYLYYGYLYVKAVGGTGTFSYFEYGAISLPYRNDYGSDTVTDCHLAY
jgi:hypothetical protein